MTQYPGLIIFDIRTPANPKEIAFLKLDQGESGNYILTLKVYGTVLYAETGQYLWIVDISDPYMPKEIQKVYSFQLGKGGGGMYDFAVSGQYLYRNSHDYRGIDVFELSTLKQIGHLDSPIGIELLLFGSSLLALSGRELEVIDISTPEYPKEMGYFTNPNPPPDSPVHPGETLTGLIDMSISGEYVYIIAFLDKLFVVDIILNILGGIIAGLFATGVYEWIRRPRLDMNLIPQASGGDRNGLLVATRHIRVSNRPFPWFLGRLLQRNDAHSCYAWVELINRQPQSAAISESQYGRANWIRVDSHPSIGAIKKEIFLSSNETIGQYVDIASGKVADIAIVEKAINEAVCFILPWRGKLDTGKYVLKIEIGSRNSSRVSKWFLLENGGVATDLNILATSFALKELREKEIGKYISLAKIP
jgi:hypothetical protein